MELSYREMIVLVRVINSYLSGDTSGESAREAREILERLEGDIGKGGYEWGKRGNITGGSE